MILDRPILLFVVLALCFGIATVLHQNFIVNPLHLEAVNLSGKTAIVTGGTDGIGKVTAKILASWGARVILPVRDERKANAVLKEITAEIKGGGKLEIFPGVDFLRLDTVRSFALQMQNETIDILVNNAGMMTYDVKQTVDGNEQLYQVNHLAPFLLTHLLIPQIPKRGVGRVVFVGSLMHYLSSGLVPSRYDVEARGMGANKQSGIALYCDTKMMNVMAAKSFQEHFPGIVFTSVHPGYVVSNLARGVPWPINLPVDWMNNMLGRSTEQGAVAQITMATHPNMTALNAGGKYFSDYCINKLCNKECFYCDKADMGVVPHKQVSDKATRDWLWDVSVAITQV